jgi:hypothetical protein
LTIGATTRPSFFYKGRTDIDVPTSETFSTAGDAGNEDNDDEDLPLDVAATIAALGERTSVERGTLWINFFFIIFAVARLKR